MSIDTLCIIILLISLALSMPIMFMQKSIIAFLAGRFSPPYNSFVTIIFERYMGAVILGLLPIIILNFNNIPPQNFGIAMSKITWTVAFILLFSALIIAMNSKRAVKVDNYSIYPQVRFVDWSILQFAIYASGWIVYLLAYEYLFRGVVFFGLKAAGWSLLANASFNGFMYAFAHLPKNKKEILASIPFGYLLCFITEFTENIWAAVVIHIMLALSNSFFAIKGNPEMRFVK